MEENILNFIKNNQEIMIPIIFLIGFFIILFLGFKQYRIHFKDRNHLFKRKFKQKCKYHFITNFIEVYYHLIPYIHIIYDLNHTSIEDYSLELYKNFSEHYRANYLFFVIAMKQKQIRINLGEDVKFLISLDEAEKLLDDLINKQLNFDNFILFWYTIRNICKERMKKGNIRYLFLHYSPVSLFLLFRGFKQEKYIDASGNEDTFNETDFSLKCIGITKNFMKGTN